MTTSQTGRRLIINADDFGQSTSINQAVIRAHNEGILTSASLMVNEPAFEEAVILARRNPKLGVGLHLSLVCGRSTLACDQIPDLVNEQNQFPSNAPRAGFHYYFGSSAVKAQLYAEIEAQFLKFHSTGLVLDHVNGHLNMHLHPVVLNRLLENAPRWGIRCLRLTCDPFWLNARLVPGRWGYRASHALIYRLLSQWARPKLRAAGIHFTAAVFGLLQNAHVNKAFLAGLLPVLPRGDSELYSHPSLHQFKHEFDALISPEIKLLARQLGIALIRYQDL